MLRLVTRTHYQVHEPRYLLSVLLKSTSPTRSDFPDRVAERIVRESAAMGRGLNRGAAGYLVDLGRATGLINDNMVWTAAGHTLSVIASGRDLAEPELTFHERACILKMLLAADGAAILFFVRAVLQQQVLPPSDSDWNSLANSMMRDVAMEYLGFVTDVRSRSAAREMLQARVRQPYSGKSGVHQCMFHLQAMLRLGFLSLDVAEGRRTYTTGAEERFRCGELLRMIPSLLQLERFAGGGDWISVLAAVYARDVTPASEAWNPDEIFEAVKKVYVRVAASGVPLVTIATLIEVVQVMALADGTSLERAIIIDTLKRRQMAMPGEIRFHVDRAGRPTFVKLSDAILLSNGEIRGRTHD